MRMCRGIPGASGRRGAMIASNVSPVRATARDPVHDLGRVIDRRACRPGVRLAVQTDDVVRPFAQQGRRPRPRRVARVVNGVTPARAAHRARVVQLRVDHRLERPQQRREPLRIALERAQHLRQGLDGRHAMIGGLAPDPVVAGRARREPDLRQRRQRGVALQQLARLPPGPVDDHQRDRTRRIRLREIDRVRPGKQEVRRSAAGQRRANLLVVVEVHAHPQLGPRQAEVREPSRPDRHVPLARVLQQQDARARRQRHQVRAVADRRRVAGSARRSRGGGRARESRRRD